MAIIGLLSSFVTMAADNSIINEYGKVNLAGKTYTARIVSPKAVVYADENMLSPLGYIANGKAIIVGNPRRMNKDLVSTVVYGRLAFIEIKDIRYEDTADEEYNARRGAPREHNFDITIQKPEERLSENNSVYFGLHTYGAGDEVKNAFYTIQNNKEVTNFSGFQFQFIHRRPQSRFFWGATFDYSTISSADMQLSYFTLGPTFGYTPLKTQLFLIDVYGSLDLSVNSTFDISNNYENEPSSFVWGPQVNARVVFFPETKYHVFGGVGLRKYSVVNLETLKDLNDNKVDGIKNITSAQIFIGVGMEFR
jgi:hypothetical protein